MSPELAQSPIVVFGAARSGTTYVVQILNKDPRVFISNETRVLAWLHHAVAIATTSQEFLYRERDCFVAHLRAELPQLIRAFYEKLAPDGTVYWGDKNPHYASPENNGCLQTVAELFPESHFVHVIRDGRDVVASGLRGVWRDFDNVHEMWKSHVDIGREFGKYVGPQRYHELRYEELVRDDEQVASEMFDFLGLDMQPGVTLFCRAQRLERTPFCDPTRDINADVQGSDWAIILSREQRVRSLELIGDHLVAFGYETRASLQELTDG